MVVVGGVLEVLGKGGAEVVVWGAEVVVRGAEIVVGGTEIDVEGAEIVERGTGNDVEEILDVEHVVVVVVGIGNSSDWYNVSWLVDVVDAEI